MRLSYVYEGDNMSEYLILYNPHSQSEHGLENAKKIEKLVDGSCSYMDVTAPDFYFPNVLRDTDPEVKIVVTGGDGTINRFLNSLPDAKLTRELYCYPGGSGNDFIRDLKAPLDGPPVLMNPHVKFKEETLLKFLDKLDWDRGDLFALGTLRHPAITAEGLRRLAPKVFARFGKSDDFLVSMFFADPRTPLDVLEAARKKGGYGEHTAKAIAERLDKDVGNE